MWNIRKLIKKGTYDYALVPEHPNATTMKDMGKVMSSITKTYAGQVEGSVVSKMVREKLS